MECGLQKIFLQLENLECIQSGNYVLKSGKVSKYYFDMRMIISNPTLLKEIGDLIYQSLDDFDILCAIPNGGMPIATYISVTYNKPMIYVRDKAKEYGSKKQIEGRFNKDDKCVIIDDVMTSGKSIVDAYNILKDVVNVQQCSVIMDRQECTKELPVCVKSIFTKTDYTRYQLLKFTREKNSNFIFSGDVSCPVQLLELLRKVGPFIVVCKLHLDCIEFSETTMSFENFKSELIDLSVEDRYLLMEDRKYVDISSIVEQQYKSISSWVDLVTVHGSVNPEVVSKLSGVVLVSNMSNNEWNYDRETKYMSRIYSNRVIGFVTQYDLQPPAIGNNILVQMTPGISKCSKKEGDQNYKTPESLETDYMIVGRAVYYAKEPVETIKEYLQDAMTNIHRLR